MFSVGVGDGFGFRGLTRSRKAFMGPRLTRFSRMIDRAPFKWLWRTVEEPLPIIYV